MKIYPRKPGQGWERLSQVVWQHVSGIRVHLIGLVRFADGSHRSWSFQEEYDAKRQQGFNRRRSVMVWGLSQTKEKE